MVKSTIKPKVNQNNTINSVLTENKTPPKSKKEINDSYYQKNKEKLKFQRQDKYQKDKELEKAKRKQRYQQQKQQLQLSTKQQSAKYYGAESIKVLMSFKEYTELNQEKRKLWLDFNWTLKDCKEAISKGFGNVVAIMKLEQVADNLIRDYWTTAKKEIKKGKSWNNLDQEQKDRLIRYWGYEKARIENGYLDTTEQLEKQSQTYLKEIELAKFHEERGKIKCDCYSCAGKEEIRKEVKAKLKKDIADYDQKNKATDKEQCPECKKWVKKLDEDSGVCKNCQEKYG